MQEQKNTTMRIGRSHAKVLLDWFSFQEQCDIRIESSSIHMDEVKFSNKLRTIIGKLKKHRSGSYVNINSIEAGMAYEWFEKIPNLLIDGKDQKMYGILQNFFKKNL
tara:strand:- start:89567 stop:89887 length:321 start_codon:yes stop_codon:yes gene_type:complete